jgi:uncharacterized protein YggE
VTVSKRNIAISALVIAATLLSVGLYLGGPGTAAAQTPEPAAGAALPRVITVVGEGRVASAPDIATASIGVEVLAPTVEEATTEAAARMEAVLAALAAQGIAERDIQTTNYSINFERFPQAEPTTAETADQPAGNYRVSNMVTVKIRDLEQVGPVMDAVIEAGANNIWGVNFILDDRTEAETQARSDAMENARARAEELAGLAGVTLGEVVQVSEVIGQASPLYGLRDSASSGIGLGGGGGPISPGELEIVTQIQVTFAIQ